MPKPKSREPHEGACGEYAKDGVYRRPELDKIWRAAVLRQLPLQQEKTNDRSAVQCPRTKRPAFHFIQLLPQLDQLGGVKPVAGKDPLNAAYQRRTCAKGRGCINRPRTSGDSECGNQASPKNMSMSHHAD